MNTVTRPAYRRSTKRRLPWAWWSLVLYPISFVVAFIVGEGIPAWLGYPDAALVAPPWWVITLAFAVAAVIFASPLVATIHFSNRATAQHEQSVRVPVVLAAILVGGFVLTNLVSGLMVMTAP